MLTKNVARDKKKPLTKKSAQNPPPPPGSGSQMRSQRSKMKLCDRKLKGTDGEQRGFYETRRGRKKMTNEGAIPLQPPT